jgi:hypothetical protein
MNTHIQRSLCNGPHNAGHSSIVALNLGHFHTLVCKRRLGTGTFPVYLPTGPAGAFFLGLKMPEALLAGQ